MKNFKILLILTAIIFTCACQNSGGTTDKSTLAENLASKDTQLKRYNVKSGIIKYKTQISGKVMGSTVDGSGTEELYFKNWGATELKKTDSKQVTHVNIFGQKQTQVDETHEITKMDNGKIYSVDMKNKVIYTRQDPAMEWIKNSNNGNVVEVGEKMLESMGGKKIGKEKVLGYNCDVWEIPGGKQWIYKGVPLKLQMKVMGITTTTTATDAKFNVNVPDKYFKLPDYPVQEIQGMGFGMENMSDEEKAGMQEDLQKIKNMSFEEYKEMLKKEDPETLKNTSEEDLKMGFEMMKKMAEQFGG